ncbi:hypothetical protein ACIQCR_30965 [Streptomyces sp. NPDC093249]|uniref:hypothetical protein n=1 Tax=unclassified Streptomyces TaxID=2593676 RepID=UPI003450779C
MSQPTLCAERLHLVPLPEEHLEHRIALDADPGRFPPNTGLRGVEYAIAEEQWRRRH